MFLFFDVISTPPRSVTVLLIVIAVCLIAAITVGAVCFAVRYSKHRKSANRLLDKSAELTEDALQRLEDTKDSRRYPR